MTHKRQKKSLLLAIIKDNENIKKQEYENFVSKRKLFRQYWSYASGTAKR
jgi:hypothetical protein